MAQQPEIEPLPPNRVVAFVDILGFRSVLNRIFRDKDAALFGRYRKALLQLSGHASLTNRPIFGLDELEQHTARATAFSDCIVFSDEATEIGASSVASKVTLLVSWLLRDGILCRGGIASGLTLHDDKIVFGEGLLKAYELESHAAVYPRIILSDTVAELVGTWPLLRIRVDIDGFRFIDPFYGLQKVRRLENFSLARIFDPPEWDRAQFEAVASHTEGVIRELQSGGESVAGLLAKWRWLANWLDISAQEYVNTSYKDLLGRSSGA